MSLLGIRRGRVGLRSGAWLALLALLPTLWLGASCRRNSAVEPTEVEIEWPDAAPHEIGSRANPTAADKPAPAGDRPTPPDEKPASAKQPPAPVGETPTPAKPAEPGSRPP